MDDLNDNGKVTQDWNMTTDTAKKDENAPIQ